MDGRELSFPIAWFPELSNAVPDQRQRCMLSEQGRTLFWSELGLAVSVAGLLLGPEGQIAFRPASPRSIAVCRAALAKCSREREPLEWAAAQTDLGNALLAQGAGVPSTVHFEEAVSAYRAALEEYGRAHTLRRNGRRRSCNSDTRSSFLAATKTVRANSRKPSQAYRAALTNRTRLQQWASAQFNLGSALVTLGEREGDTTRFEEAVAAYGAALEQHGPSARPPMGHVHGRPGCRVGEVGRAARRCSHGGARNVVDQDGDRAAAGARSSELAAHRRELELVAGFIESNLQRTGTLVDRLNMS